MFQSGTSQQVADPVWVMVLFDLPVKTKVQRRNANRYRNLLLDFGFLGIQYSVYAKYLVNASGLRAMLPTLKERIPSQGEVRILRLTDEQWAATYRFYGRTEVPIEMQPTQLGLFVDEET